MIVRVKSLLEDLFGLLLTKCVTLDEPLLPQSSSFCIGSNLGISGFRYGILFIFESSQLSEFSTDLQDSGL